MAQSRSNPWAVLQFREDKYSHLNPTGLYLPTLSIGRAPCCDLVLQDEFNRVSGKHCEIIQNEDGFYITDFSTNGTVVNLDHLRRGETISLKDKDLVHLVKHPNDSTHDISFVFCTSTDVERPCNNTPPLSQPQFSSSQTQNFENINDEEISVPATLTRIREMNPACESNIAGKTATATKTESDPMADNLLCSICCEIIHSCISLQPCMHSFCGGCYSEWMQRSNKCPECRAEVTRISKNHLISNVIHAFLKQNPDKKRPAEDIAELEAKNKITDDMLYPPKKKMRETKHAQEGADIEEGDDDEDEDDDEQDEDGDDSTQETPFSAISRKAGRVFQFSQCYQCPNYPESGIQEAALRKAPLYVCPQNGDHILCKCCQIVFPNRNGNPHIPQTKCSTCASHFCHLYWGCRGRLCKDTGCLMPFKDFRMKDWELATKILRENEFEAEFLAKYLDDHQKSWTDMFQQQIQKLDSAQLKSLSENINSNSVLCINCCEREAQELAYEFRKSIPSNQLHRLPEDKRPDCHWGRNCRTQKHNENHAQRFNHICEQTKFSN